MPRGRKKAVFDPSKINYNDPALKEALKQGLSEYIDYQEQIEGIKESQKISMEAVSDNTGIPKPLISSVFRAGYKNFQKGENDLNVVLDLLELAKG